MFVFLTFSFLNDGFTINNLVHILLLYTTVANTLLELLNWVRCCVNSCKFNQQCDYDHPSAVILDWKKKEPYYSPLNHTIWILSFIFTFKICTFRHCIKEHKEQIPLFCLHISVSWVTLSFTHKFRNFNFKVSEVMELDTNLCC